MIGSKEVAEILGIRQHYFTDVFYPSTPDFPRAIRLTESSPRRWRREEIEAWLETRREAA